MKAGMLGVMGIVLFGLAQWVQADTIRWKADYLKLGKVDAGTGGWGVEMMIGETRGAGEFVMPVELVYRNTEEGVGLFGVQWRSPQLESRLIPKSEDVLEWRTPWGSVVELIQGRKASQYQDVRREWQAAEITKHRFNLTRKDGWKFEYDNGLLKQATSPNGRMLIYQYKDKRLSKMVQKAEGAGEEWTLVEVRTDADTGCVKWLKAGGVEYEFEYHQAEKDGPAQLISWKQGQGSPECFEYNRQGVLAGITSPGGKRETLEAGLLPDERKTKSDRKAEEKPLVKDFTLMKDGQYEYTYSDKESVSAKDALGRVQNVYFSGLRGILTLTDNAGRTSRVKFYRQLGLRYDLKVRQVKNTEGRVVLENKYDKDGNLVWTRNLIGAVTQFEMNPQGKIGKVIRTYKGSVPETVAVMEYDKEGRLIRLTDVLNQRQEWRYNQAGDLAEAVDQEGRRYQFNYDSRGFLLSYADAEGNLWKIDYDSQGRPLRLTSPNGVKIEYKMDQAGRVTAVERLLPGGNEQAVALMQRAYDAAGRPASVTDALGRTAKYEYDGQGRPASTMNPLGVATRYEYDEANRLQSFWMQGSDGSVRGKTTLNYTAMDQPEKQIDALGNELSWQYDSHGLMVCKNMGDQEIRYTYDKYGRPATVDYGRNNVVKYTYDNAGRPATVSTPKASADYRYDKLGRLVETILCRVAGPVTQSAGETNVLHYSWTPTGQKAAVEWQRVTPEGVTKGRTEYLYNKAGAVAEIRSDGKTVATYSSDKQGNLLGKQLVDGTQELYRHDALGRITDMTVKSASGKTLTQVAYTWDNADQLVRRTWDGKVQNYVYDEAGQLTGVKSAGLPEERYAYDPAGNMIEKMIGGDKTVMTYDMANRLTVLERADRKTVKYEYDGVSRLAREISGEETTEYRYGLFEKVSMVLKPGERRADYAYWPEGQMAEKQATDIGKSSDSGHSTLKPETFLWDGLVLLARGEEKFAIEPHISGGVPLVASGKEGQTVVVSDFLGTTLGVVKGEKFIPTPLTAFGERTGNEKATEGEAFFTGKPYDSDLKAYTFLFRNYKPELGRWTAADPSGFPDGGNNWLYCNNMLANTVDPLGLSILPMEYYWLVNYKVKSGVSLNSEQMAALQAMISYAQTVVSRLNTDTAIYNLNVNTGNITVDPTLNVNFDSADGVPSGAIYIVNNIENNADIAGMAGTGTGILLNIRNLAVDALAHEMGHAGGYNGGDIDGGTHSSDWHNIMTPGPFLTQTDPNLVILDNVYSTAVRSLAIPE